MLIILILFTWLSHFSLVSSSSISSGLELVFPRNGELLVLNECSPENFCKLGLYIFGVFPTGSSYQLPLSVTTKLSNMATHHMVVNEAYNDMFSYSIYVYGNKHLLKSAMVVQITVTDGDHVTIHYDERITLLLASSYDIYNMKKNSLLSRYVMTSNNDQQHSPLYTTTTATSMPNFIELIVRDYLHTLQRQGHKNDNDHTMEIHAKSEGKRKKLDFLEIGTCDMDTIIQQLTVLYDTKKPNGSGRVYRGISIDMLSSYLNRLPDVQQILKLHTAIAPAHVTTVTNNTTTISWQPAYYLPDYFIESHLQQVLFLKGMSRLNALTPAFIMALRNEKEEEESYAYQIIQKEYVPSIPITSLLHWLHDSDSDSGMLNVLKLDVETLDNLIVRDVIHFYLHHHHHHYSNSNSHVKNVITSQWPCVLFFEVDIFHTLLLRSEDKIEEAVEEEEVWRILQDSKEVSNKEIMRLLQYVGYNLLHELYNNTNNETVIDHALLFRAGGHFLDNAMAFNCHCTHYDFEDAWSLLNLHIEYPFQSALFDTLCNNIY